MRQYLRWQPETRYSKRPSQTCPPRFYLAMERECGGLVKAALKAANLPEEHYQRIEAAIGPAATAKLFEFFGFTPENVADTVRAVLGR